MSDMSDYPTWKTSARKSAEAAIDIYTDREADVERELALHLARALRELDKRDGTEDDAAFEEAMAGHASTDMQGAFHHRCAAELFEQFHGRTRGEPLREASHD